MRDTGITQLRATIAEQANILGVDFKDLVPKKARKKRKSKEEDDRAPRRREPTVEEGSTRIIVDGSGS